MGYRWALGDYPSTSSLPYPVQEARYGEAYECAVRRIAAVGVVSQKAWPARWCRDNYGDPGDPGNDGHYLVPQLHLPLTSLPAFDW